MRQPHIAGLGTMLLTGVAACASGGSPPVSSPQPSAPAQLDPRVSGVTYLRFTPGTYRYRFRQTADIRGSGAGDTVPGTITTQAVIHVTVSSQPDSGFAIAVSFDSIITNTQGPIPQRAPLQSASLDSVLQGSFLQTGGFTETPLPDSLCAYSQFAGTARALLLPELSVEVETPTKRTFTDRTSQRSCRAGVMVDVITKREVRNTGRDTGEMTIEEETELQGAGLLRRDSVTIRGSTSTRGTASFGTLNRLPTAVRTDSDGKITVQFGSMVTEFRQRTTQEIQLIETTPH